MPPLLTGEVEDVDEDEEGDDDDDDDEEGSTLSVMLLCRSSKSVAVICPRDDEGGDPVRARRGTPAGGDEVEASVAGSGGDADSRIGGGETVRVVAFKRGEERGVRDALCTGDGDDGGDAARGDTVRVCVGGCRGSCVNASTLLDDASFMDG